MSELESLFQEINEAKEKDKQQFERIKYTKDFINRRNVRITKKFKFSIKKKN